MTAPDPFVRPACAGVAILYAGRVVPWDIGMTWRGETCTDLGIGCLPSERRAPLATDSALQSVIVAGPARAGRDAHRTCGCDSGPPRPGQSPPRSFERPSPASGPYLSNRAQFVVACEQLEQLDDPERGIA